MSDVVNTSALLAVRLRFGTVGEKRICAMTVTKLKLAHTRESR